jgi:hypothetical protein
LRRRTDSAGEHTGAPVACFPHQPQHSHAGIVDVQNLVCAWRRSSYRSG